MASCARSGSKRGLERVAPDRIMVRSRPGVAVLQWTGALAWLGAVLSPAMGLFAFRARQRSRSSRAADRRLRRDRRGLLDPLTAVQVTVLALMVLTAHNLVVESTVQGRSGPPDPHGAAQNRRRADPRGPSLAVLRHGDQGASYRPLRRRRRTRPRGVRRGVGGGSARLLLKIYLIVLSLTVGTELMRAYGLFEALSRFLRP